MKINVEFDLTPQEFRQAMGLPDVEAFQQELMERFRRQMEAGVEGYDPMSLLKPLMAPGAGTPFAKFMPPGMAEGMMGGAPGAGNAGQGAAGGMPGDMGESMAQGMAAFNQYQKMMLDTLQQFGQGGAEGKDADKTEPAARRSSGRTSDQGADQKAEQSASRVDDAKPASAASARSRAKRS
ncbi:DUF6489 family protein [Cobetia sp. 1AS1]|uniref:DUF6489 family protein n=1 Tax=Cobetia sp. 1AS1 TaxID=3040016 RepID=UPI002449855B|nr:DUF6489 family protein [Cobetia sp. 1AS1]MDH2293151.1 DUF6489 family protein [Cobetia sp. 1AS1]